VAAFRATLEEVLEADLILHVRDAAHDESEAQKDDVLAVLKELGISVDGERPILEVLNKIDLLDPAIAKAMLTRNRARNTDEIATSALTGAGTDDLLLIIDRILGGREDLIRVTLGAEDGAGLAWAHRSGRVLERDDADGKVVLTIAADPETAEKFTAHFPGRVDFLKPQQRRRA
jgi:GTP-binding protein HflX